MGSPKHLWSGDWESESAAARGRGAELPAVRRQEPDPPAPPRAAAPSRTHPPRPRARRPRSTRRRRHISHATLRQWTLAAGIALVAGFIAVSLIGMLTRSSAPASGTEAARRQAATGALATAWLGVRLRTRSPGDVVITGVTPSGPAAAAGLTPGDVIAAVDGTPIVTAADVNAVLMRDRPGQVVAVQALRGTAGFTAQVGLAPRPRGNGSP